MKGKIRNDLTEYIFKTESGKVIDNTKYYDTRHLNDEVFQVNVDGEWCDMESIDWEFML